MLQMTSIWSFDKTADLEYGLRYHPSQRLLLKQQLDCMMNPYGSFTYYVIKFLAFPPPPSVINRNQDPTPPLTAILRNQGLTPHFVRNTHHSLLTET